MDDQQVQAQLQQMQNFIQQEAEDKASEIRAKAGEEFSIEKSRLVMAEKLKIMKDYEKKEKNIETQKKIAYSNELNQSRLKVLKARDDVIQRLYVEAQKMLGDVGKPGEPYKQLLKSLIVQGLTRLNETRALVTCRKEDVELVQSVLSDVKAEFEKLSGKTVEIIVDSVNFLAPGPSPNSKGATCSGGVILSANEGRIVSKNTLDARLALAFDQCLPEIRYKLFGKSKTRVHTT